MASLIWRHALLIIACMMIAGSLAVDPPVGARTDAPAPAVVTTPSTTLATTLSTLASVTTLATVPAQPVNVIWDQVDKLVAMVKTVSPKSAESIDALIKIVKSLTKKPDIPDPCTPKMHTYASNCLATAGKNLPAFATIAKVIKSVIKKDPKEKPKISAEQMKDAVTKIVKDTSNLCSEVYDMANCFAQHLCVSTAACTTQKALKHIGELKSKLDKPFGSSGPCHGSGKISRLGCNDVDKYRKLESECAGQISKKVDKCKVDSLKKANDKEPKDKCLPLYYKNACLAQAKCNLCDWKVARIAQTVLQAEVDAKYSGNSSCSPKYSPRSVKCIWWIPMLVIILVLLLLSLIGIIICCICMKKNKDKAPSKPAASPSKGTMVKSTIGKANMGKSKMPKSMA